MSKQSTAVVKMSGLEENIKELLFLSDLIRSQDFRASFITHFTSKVRELEDVSSKIEVKILQRLQLKLLDPLMFHLKNTSNSNDKFVLIQCIIQVLKITSIHSVSEFFDVYTALFFQIFEGGNLSYKPSEELKECVLECCSFLVRNSSPNLFEEVYAEESGAKFSLGISIAVNVVKGERSVKLRLAALDFLLAASLYENQLIYISDIYNKVGGLFMLYLPGILGPLLEVILRDETQHHLITTKALTCWGHVLCVVMKDSLEEENLSDREIVEQWLVSQNRIQDHKIDINKGLKEKKRTKLWLQSAAVTLHPLFVKLSELRKHSHPKCRLELTLVMVKLLKSCKKNLKNFLPVIIEVLVSSAVDEDTIVCQVAEKALNELECECNKRNIDIFMSVIEENLYSVINKLPRVLQFGNEQLLLQTLKSMSGYLKILGKQNRLNNLIGLSSTLKKLISVIKISFELEVYPEVSKQDFSLWDNQVESCFWFRSWKRFRHFTDQSIKNQLEEICQDLGNFGNPEVIFDFLLDSFNESCSFEKEVLLILNEVISGASKLEGHVVNELLDFYLKPQNLCLPFQVNGSDCANLKEAQTNIVQVVLILEGIGKLAKRMGKNFQEYLFKTLYHVLQRMGSSFSIIREAASKSAVAIADACEYKGSVKSLIENNVDYLSYHLTINLKRNEEGVLDVITVLIKNSPFHSLPNLEEIINNVLKTSSQNFDSPYTLSYLRLFQTFVACVTRWIQIDVQRPKTNPRIDQFDLNRLLNYLENKKETEFEEKEENAQEDSETVSPSQEETNRQEYDLKEPEKPELPRHLKLTLAIANHCVHHLATKDQNKKIIVLEILNECVWALAEWEDHLLPLVHCIWSPLTTKFEALTDSLVINRSFKLLCSLSSTSKSFVRARTLKNVLPALESFLIKQADKSKLKDSASGYFFTQNFKLQRELLSNLGKLASSLELFEKQTDLVIESALPYLSSLQPRELQDKCQVFFEDVESYDKHLVWYKVHNLVANSEFTKNADIVLKRIK